MVIGGRAHTIEQIHEVGKLGYPFAEIDVKDPEEVKQQYDELMELKNLYGIYYLAHYPNEDNPMDAQVLKERFVPKMKELLELTRRLGIEKGTLHFWMDKRWAAPALIPQKIELLSEMVDYATQNNVILCLENLTERYDSFSVAFDAVPDLRMTLDIGHAQLLSKENTSFNFIKYLFNRIAHLHVHDNRGGKTVKDDLHLPLGEGVVDYPRILTMLNEKGYNSTITMEVLPKDMLRTRQAMEGYIGC
jgi:sugar phosphate isomerase/epimerase